MNSTTNSIFDDFPISNEEYQELDNKFGNLCHYATWQLLKKNARNNHTDDFDDIDQTLRAALVHAGCYYKRQVYIERCFKVAKEYAKDKFIKFMVKELEKLWTNRTRHGANRQKYGKYQEELLERIVQKTVPKDKQPSKSAPLVIDAKFPTYCKQIIWNQQKALGKRITREKTIRTGLTSLSEYDYLASLE